MTKTKTLQARLAQSLDHANKKEQKAHIKTPTPLPAEAKCKKLSISLFDTDLKRLDSIRSYMAQRGSNISTSEAVKLALRTAKLSDELAEALAEARKEDGRGKW